MATPYTIRVNRSGVREIMRSQAVAAELHERGEKIAAAAGEGMEVESHIGANRARTIVTTATFEARQAEAKDRRLTKALDAVR